MSPVRFRVQPLPLPAFQGLSALNLRPFSQLSTCFLTHPIEPIRSGLKFTASCPPQKPSYRWSVVLGNLREYALGRSAGAANLFTFSQPIWRLNNFDIVRDKRDFFIAGPGDRGQIRSSRWSEPPSQKNIASAEDKSASPPNAEKNLPTAARVNRNDFALFCNNSEDSYPRLHSEKAGRASFSI